MICNLCVKQDVCRLKEATEEFEQKRQNHYQGRYNHIELDCRHRERGTTEQIQRMKERTDDRL